MVPFSKLSIVFVALGLLAFVINSIADGIIAPVALMGFVFLFLGVLLSFIAMSKKESGNTKVISFVAFFSISFYVVWFEPHLFLYVVTWLKNAF